VWLKGAQHVPQHPGADRRLRHHRQGGEDSDHAGQGAGGQAVGHQREGALPLQRDLRDAAGPPQEFYDAQERIAAARVKSVVDAAALEGLACAGHTIEALHPWEAITDYANTQGCDLIVMASHGRRGVSALLLGSETQKVLTHSNVPILVVK
jgi:nucleotide-binding universal stress UspA family protein